MNLKRSIRFILPHLENMKIINTHDSSSDDDVPLKYCSTNGYNWSRSNRSLYQTYAECCEFCEKVSHNRYESLVHNATHIIIPLINQKVVTCKECQFCFTSQNDLQHHIQMKHPNIPLPHCNNAIDHINIMERKRKSKSKMERMKNRIRFEDDEEFENINELLDDLTTECKVTIDISDQPILNKALEVSKCNINILSYLSDNTDERDNSVMYKNKYVFGRYSTVIPDGFADECKSYVNSHSKNNEVKLNFDKSSNEKKLTEVNNLEDVEKYYESVHYDVLREPKIVTCKRCNQVFPDRYSLIMHEVSHIIFNTRLPPLCITCDKYIAGTRQNLNHHIRTHHSDYAKANRTKRKCLECGLYYISYLSHVDNYHRYEQKEVLNYKYEKIMEICDLCYKFLKSKTNRYYIRIGSVSKLGHRKKCNVCMREFFELNKVRKTQIKINYGLEKKRNKPLTNNQRLKNIQMRFKNINKLRKF
ncbi:unnamed protein product [Parnassius apollo]|uniref:(apollo) hypothetical protein n=1 Tax=Parnassius apollo TaxID=110799 RepID=A0A8S3XPL8_PARAO|nr:unnamed protein product [Parnassius apollo]